MTRTRERAEWRLPSVAVDCVVRRHYADGNRFASRTNAHEPLVCFRKIDSALPDLTFASPPESGVMRTVSRVQQYAKSSETSTSWTSPLESTRCDLRKPRSPFSNVLRPFIGGLPGIRNTTSSDIRPRTVSTSPAAVARCHCLTRFRIVCSSAFMEPPFVNPNAQARSRACRSEAEAKPSAWSPC